MTSSVPKTIAWTPVLKVNKTRENAISKSISPLMESWLTMTPLAVIMRGSYASLLEMQMLTMTSTVFQSSPIKNSATIACSAWAKSAQNLFIRPTLAMTVSPTIPCQLLTMERKCQTTIVTRTLSTVVLMTTPATRRLRMERSASTITTCASQTSAWMTWISVDSACSHLIAKMRISSVPPIIYARRLRETLETHAQMTASVTRAHAIEMAIA